MELTKLTIAELQQGYANRQFSVTEVVSQYLAAIGKLDGKLKAFLVVQPESALARATELDRALAAGKEIGALAGVPLAVKDCLLTKGLQTTAGSQILAHYLPPYNATAVERLIKEGVIILGKTNCDEFAMGSSTENSAFGPTYNPWDLTRVPGGSSGGSAAAVAASLSLVALGSDTAGSIRQPASFCGVVGLKPTYGRVSRFGLIAMASSFDTVGPFSRTVADSAQVMQIIAGQDARDATSQARPVDDYLAALTKPVKDLTIGVPQEFFADGLDKYVAQAVRQAIDVFTNLGARVISVSLPTLPYALAAYYVIMPAEVSANLARYDGIKFGERIQADNLLALYHKTRGQLLGSEAKRRIMLGTYVLSSGYYESYYKRAQTARRAIQADFVRAFKEVDVLATPTAPTVAFPLGSHTSDPLSMYLQDVYTVPVNIAGLPAISLPGGFVDKLPVGLQLIGSAWSESTILRLAYAYEQATPWHNYTPTLPA
ncbi:MAG: Asp-tRNA(Asn)/Glu-tRNA(Gln) amidotransferase subunit GatA [Candidatus Kerfeldbacteria bacterium]|nr:Asp-tRNA(Asn)/Glu-tRNA(Gln) amidotransferase subunit GatA [Candidatus Kerfeldbacteria bacterium]